jgi:transaldolase
MTEDGVLGVTSNPTILQQAIAQSELYDQELQELTKKMDDPREIFRRIAVRDIRDASDIFMPVYEQTEHKDGYVSLEVAPELAFDTEGTITRAKLLWEMVDRPNLLVKIPATKESLEAIEDSIAAGISVNVTLIFLSATAPWQKPTSGASKDSWKAEAIPRRLPAWRASSSAGWTPRPTGGSRSSGARISRAGSP